MKKYFFVFVLFSGIFYSSSLSAQLAINNTTETWIISFQDAETVIPPGTHAFTIGPDVNAGRGVLRFLDQQCNNKFQTSGTWVSTCTPLTSEVIYTAATIISPFLPPATPATFVFNP